MKQSWTSPDAMNVPLVHLLHDVYRRLYKIGYVLPKKDKLGIHAKIESLTLKILSTSIRASFSQKQEKTVILMDLRVRLESLKHLIRIEHELGIITEKTYIEIQTCLQEGSKMTNGWIKYITKNPA